MSESPIREEQVTPEQETDTLEQSDVVTPNPANDFTMAGNPAIPPIAAVSSPAMPMQGTPVANGSPSMAGTTSTQEASVTDTEAPSSVEMVPEMVSVADGTAAGNESGEGGDTGSPADAGQEATAEGDAAEGAEGRAQGSSAEEFQASGQQMDTDQADPVVDNPDEDPAFQGVMDYTTTVSDAQGTHQTAEESLGQLQAASPRSEEEQQSRNDQLGHIGTMSQVAESQEQEKKTFTADSFKTLLQEHLDTLSRQMPTNKDEAEDFKDSNPVEAVNENIANTVNSEKDQLAGPLSQQAEQPEPPASGVATVAPVPPTQEETGPQPEPVDQVAAVPKPLNDSEIAMDNESQSMDDFMDANEVTETQLANSNEPAFTGALDSKNEAQVQAAAAPAAYRQTESEQLSAARTEAEAQSTEQLTAMHAMRESALGGVLTDQETTAQTDQDKQKIIFDNLKKIYDDTKTKVTEKLDGLSEKVDTLFSTKAEEAKDTFEGNVKKKLNEIYGWTVLDDLIFGEDTEAIEGVFNTEKARFERKMNSVIDELATLIADELNATIDLIKKGKTDSEDYFKSLDTEQQKLGADAFADFNDQYDSLEETVAEKENELAQGLASSYHENVEALRESFDSIKESVSAGWIGAAFNALAGVIATILEIKDLLLNLLSAAIDAIGAIISDPIGFLSNLIEGIVQGFVNFKNNLLNNIMTGLIEWLTGSLGNVGITIPDNLFSLAGIFDLVMQILGLTWDYFRDKAVRLLGEPVVQAMETGFEVFMIIKEKGIEGLWEYVKDQFNDLQAMVMDAIRDMIITKVIEAGVKWIMGLMSPAGAFIKAAMMIIDIARFFIERAAQIIELVSAFVDGIRALANGDVSAVAKAVEKALVKAIPVLIGFLASLVGISGLTGKVQKIIKKVRGKIDRAINKVIKKAKKAFGKLVKKGKAKVKGAVGAVLNWLGIKKKFTDQSGEKHTIYFTGKEKNAKLMIASRPTELDKYLAQKKTDAKEANDSEALTNIGAAETLLSKIQVITRSDVDNQEAEKITDHMSKLSIILMKIGGPVEDVELPEDVKWSHQGGIKKSSSVEKLSSETAIGGTNNTGSKSPNGFAYLQRLSLTDHDKGHWVRMHLISSAVGGKAENYNLIPAPHSMNTGSQVVSFEKALKALMNEKSAGTKRPNVIWIKVQVKRFYPENKIPPHNYGRTDYVHKVLMQAGVYFHDGKDWNKDAKAKVSESLDIQIPDFSKSGKISINTDGENKISTVAKCSKDFAMHILRERVRGGKFKHNNSTDFERRMNDYWDNILKNNRGKPYKKNLDKVIDALNSGDLNY
ncbi:MAG: hypothetical protein WBA74_09855 [Cyclobacteriaceae bacterium]